MKILHWSNLVLLIGLMTILCGCKETITHERGDIVAVWKHDAGEYSVTAREGHRLIDKGFGNRESATLIEDVGEKSNMWYEADFVDSEAGYQYYKNVIVHVHSIDDVNGAGWKRQEGKRTVEGSTERVQ